MSCILICFSIVISTTHFSSAEINLKVVDIPKIIKIKEVGNENDVSCRIEKCPIEDQAIICGFSEVTTSYKMFPSKCALHEYPYCYKIAYVETPLEYCVKEHNKLVTTRRMYGESCPVFCPSHWRPVCGASKLKSYSYRTFNNGCYMDMLNCRGEDEDLGYVEVPLEFCQRHNMKNMYKEQVLISGMHDYRDYE